MSSLPVEVSLTEFSAMTGLTREQVRYRAQRGGIPTVRLVPGNPRSKRVVNLSSLQAVAPDLWSSLVLRAQMALAGE